MLAIDMARLATERACTLDLGKHFDGVPDDAVPMRFQELGGPNGVGERDRAAQGLDRFIAVTFVLGVLQRAPAADDLGRVG